jgi:hypothetical protein
MKRALYLILLIAVIASAVAWWRHCTAAPKEEGIARLKPVRAIPFSNISSSVTSYTMAIDSGKPSDELDLPAGISESSPHIQYYRIPIGSRTAVVLVENLPNGRPRAWLDTNLNNRLSDEKALTGVAKRYSESRSYTVNYTDFGIAQLTDGDFTSSRFRLLRFEDRFVGVSPAYYQTGRMLLGNRIYRLALIDGDYDGQYNTHFAPSENFQTWGYDSMALDGNSYGLFGRNEFDSGKIVPLGRFYKFNERYFSIAVSEDGKSVQMTPAEPVMGTLKIGNNIRFSSELLSDAGAQHVIFDDTLAIPAGRYQPRWASATLTFSDTEGGQWDMVADVRNDIRKGIFEIVEGQTTTLNFGPPFTIKTDIVKRGDEQLSINANLVGSEGEEYGLRIVRSAGRPELKILAENGDTLHTGSMEYG